MTKHTYQFQVKSSAPPVIEIDPSATAFYVRFKNCKVSRTIPSHCENGVLNLDLTEENEVIGIESVGMDNMSVKSIVTLARVYAPKIDFSKAPMRWAGAQVPA
jgi:hypothetical protein